MSVSRKKAMSNSAQALLPVPARSIPGHSFQLLNSGFVLEGLVCVEDLGVADPDRLDFRFDAAADRARLGKVLSRPEPDLEDVGNWFNPSLNTLLF